MVIRRTLTERLLSEVNIEPT